MDNYEVNVLTRKGGWKKLPQEITSTKDDISSDDNNNSDNLNINVTNDSFEELNRQGNQSNLFENFTEIGSIIHKLKNVENEKSKLLSELASLKNIFESRKDMLDKKLDNINKEQEMYQKAINLINSLKNI